MSYDVKRTEYAFLPDGPYPLDVRSHFVNFAVANETITGDKVSTVELANESNDTQKFYYHGEIITTTEGGVYQVCGENQYYQDIEELTGSFTLEAEDSGITATITFEETTHNIAQTITVTAHGWEFNFSIPDKLNAVTLNGKLSVTPGTWSGTFKITPTIDGSCYLRPFSGSGGGGGSSLIINPSGGLSNPNTGLQIKIPEVSGVQINNAGLSIKVLNPTTDTDGTIHGSGITISANGIGLNTGPGLTINDTGQLTVNYGKGLTINPETNALEVDGDLDVRGVHSSVDRDYDVDKNILDGNYVYQEI